MKLFLKGHNLTFKVMTKIQKTFFPFLLFLIINILVCKYTNSSDYVYDKHLTNYKYFSKVHKFQFISQGISLETAYMYLSSNNKYKGTVTLLHGKNFTSNYWKEIALN